MSLHLKISGELHDAMVDIVQIQGGYLTRLYFDNIFSAIRSVTSAISALNATKNQYSIITRIVCIMNMLRLKRVIRILAKFLSQNSIGYLDCIQICKAIYYIEAVLHSSTNIRE